MVNKSLLSSLESLCYDGDIASKECSRDVSAITTILRNAGSFGSLFLEHRRTTVLQSSYTSTFARPYSRISAYDNRTFPLAGDLLVSGFGLDLTYSLELV
jgi:hypothetical protein